VTYFLGMGHAAARRGSGASLARSAARSRRGRAIVHDPEHAPGGAVGLVAHDLPHEAVEGGDARPPLAAAESCFL